MKQVLIKKGEATIEIVPTPKIESGHVLVTTRYSCISAGTELVGVKMSSLPLWKRALHQPQNLKKVINMLTTSGVSKTYSYVSGQLAAGSPTGYSLSGIVMEVGEGTTDLQIGERVTCSGAQCAHHAEVVCIPRNLVSSIPETVSFEEASTVTLGAIALQGVRRANPTLGETFVVLGLGLLGQLTAQILRANGCRVIGMDLDQTRVQLAQQLGMDLGIYEENGDAADQVARLTDGMGADGVIITAASNSDAIISTAFQCCRKKGRVVLVGDVGLHLNRSDFYQKELDFFISSSYGPGRYDRQYEEKGLDYPVAFVRWTENRNMGEYLHLIQDGRINIKPLIESIYPIDQAREAYQALQASGKKPMMVLLRYDQQQEIAKSDKKIFLKNFKSSSKKKIEFALIGAGGFAKGMHLPNIEKLKNFQLRAVVSRNGHNAFATAKQFGAEYATTDYDQVLSDANIDAVLITTPHHLHAGMTLAALKAGKHVFVEKPLCLNVDELNEVKKFYENAQNIQPILCVGFNRRFSKYLKKINEITACRASPMIMNYRMNAGYIPLDHWVHGAEGGGRNIGEACHIYDLFTYLTNSTIVSMDVLSIAPSTHYYSKTDNFVVIIKFAEGSVATLTYTALGSKNYPKETMEIYVDGKVISLMDYKELNIYGAKIPSIKTKYSDKGQYDELVAFEKTVLKGGDWPIPLWQILQVSELSFLVEQKIKG